MNFSLGWLGASYVGQAGLEPTDIYNRFSFGPPTSSEIMTHRLTLSYERLALPYAGPTCSCKLI